jgi:hypothetical protein
MMSEAYPNGMAAKYSYNPASEGSLSAVEKSGETAVLQLHDGTPPTKYSWLGASGLATEAASAATASGGGSYVPQLGRPLQTQPIESPGTYADGSPYGPYTTGVSAQSETLGTDLANGAPEREAARLAAAKKIQEEEEAKARERAEMEARLNAPTPTEGGAEPLGGSEGWACQYAKQTGQEGEGCGPSAAEMAEILGCAGGQACASSTFGAIVHWVSSNAHKLVAAGIGAVSSIAVGAVTLVAVAACGATAELTEDPFVAYDCYKIGSFGFSLALGGAAFAVKAWNVEKN